MRTYTVKQVADMLHTSSKTVRQMLHRGDLPYFLPHGNVRGMVVREDALEQYITENERANRHADAVRAGWSS